MRELLEAAEALERRARWKFKAGDRIWQAYLKTLDRPGDADMNHEAMNMARQSGQMERDAAWLRQRALTHRYALGEVAAVLRPGDSVLLPVQPKAADNGVYVLTEDTTLRRIGGGRGE